MEKRVFELTIVLPPQTTQEATQALVEGWLKKSGGKVVAFEFWGKKQLMYPIKKQTSGVYGHFKLELSSKQVAELNKRMALEEELMRGLLIKVK